jgi:integrase
VNRPERGKTRVNGKRELVQAVKTERRGAPGDRGIGPVVGFTSCSVSVVNVNECLNRDVPLAASLRADLETWLQVSPVGAEAWLFPSEKLDKPISRDNVLRRYIQPRLKTVGLEWVDFQVMRRTHSSLMHELRLDPKIVADMMGHDVNVNLNHYTQTSLESVSGS